MSLNTKDGIDKFVSDHLSEMLDELNDTYGPILFEELKNRIKFTIDEFNQEMTTAFSNLKKCEEERQKMYNIIKSGNLPEDNAANDEADNNEKSTWEKKIEEIESQK